MTEFETKSERINSWLALGLGSKKGALVKTKRNTSTKNSLYAMRRATTG